MNCYKLNTTTTVVASVLDIHSIGFSLRAFELFG